MSQSGKSRWAHTGTMEPARHGRSLRFILVAVGAVVAGCDGGAPAGRGDLGVAGGGEADLGGRGADLGAVGEDPETTSLVWDGAAGATLLKLDAWYNRVSRITFDGKAKAAVGLERSGSFATYGELSDLQFKDFTAAGLLLGNGAGGGIAEQ